MPQLTPFYFVNEVVFAFAIIVLTFYLLSEIILAGFSIGEYWKNSLNYWIKNIQLYSNLNKDVLINSRSHVNISSPPGNKRYCSTNRKIHKDDAFKDINLSSLDHLIRIVEHEISTSDIKKKSIFTDYYVREVFADYLNNENTKRKEYISVYDDYGNLLVKLSLEQYHEKVLQHKASLTMPKLNEYKLEKEAFLEWVDYNTPSIKNLTVTPLFGTHLQIRDQDDEQYDSYISEWNTAYFYLILEYSILKNAKSYIDNSNLSDECEKAYYYWVNRQFNMLGPINEIFRSDVYFNDFYSDLDFMKREIYQDCLYVVLNILLAKSILQNSNLNNNNKINLSVLNQIISDHYNTYDEGYKCIFELRKYKSNFECTVGFLKDAYKLINKDKSNVLGRNNNNWYAKYLG